MPANQKVSVAWQIVFTFLPIVNFWAFYRIRKLRKYLLYVIVPEIALSILLVIYFFSAFDIRQTNPFDPTAGLLNSEAQLTYAALSYGTSIALQGLTIYLVIVWSRQHNQRIDASKGQAPG